MTDHRHWMAKAIEFSKFGLGNAEPNPMVGCVLVKNGQMVGQGWHRKYGGPHAEVNAVSDAGEEANGSTAYVSLEPCCHHGKTPPCSRLLIDSGIKEVFIACRDPNPKVSGGGIEMLEKAGIPVNFGLMEAEAKKVLAPFLKGMNQQLPWVIAKWAMTLDGKIACHSGHSQWITSKEARQHVHKLRGRCDAVLVGSGTVLEDDPMLNSRPKDPDTEIPRQATRIVLDRRLRIPISSKLVQTANQYPTLIATSAASDPKLRDELTDAGCQIWIDPEEAGTSLPRQFFQFLFQQGMTNILVEGGGILLGELFDQDLVDEVFAYIGPKIVGGSNASSPVGGTGKPMMDLATNLQDCEFQQLGPDFLVQGRVKTESC